MFLSMYIFVDRYVYVYCICIFACVSVGNAAQPLHWPDLQPWSRAAFSPMDYGLPSPNTLGPFTKNRKVQR